jgi:membrane protease YdiL (CAAX protease family)
MKKTEIVGIHQSWGADLFTGIFTFVGIFVLNFLIPGVGTIGIPSVAQSIASATGRGVVIVAIAPIFETFFFFGIVLFLFYDKFKLPFFLSAVFTSATFMLFHISAYGNFASASGSFITAGIMGMVFAYQTKLTKSLLPATVTHALLNFFIAYLSLAVVIH